MARASDKEGIGMKKSVLLWSLAIILTLLSAGYQRKTGPTYPMHDKIAIDGSAVSYSFARSHGGDGDQPVTLTAPDTAISGRLFYRRFKAPEEFMPLQLMRIGDTLFGALPHQPPAGKLEYYVELSGRGKTMIVPERQAVVTRFKGEVPPYVLAPHIILMFIAMLFSTRTGLEAFSPNGRTRNLTIWTVVTLCIGGMILGPLVQRFAFGELWTGVPFGWDLTDNKTLIAFLGWIAALIGHRGGRYPRYIVIAAAVLLLAVYLVPHSVLGSELDYATGKVRIGQ
jgi:hypothetical protein